MGEAVVNAGGADVQLGDATPRPRMWVGKRGVEHRSFDHGTWAAWYVAKSAAESTATWQAWRPFLTPEAQAWLDSLHSDTWRESIHHAMSVWPGGGS